MWCVSVRKKTRGLCSQKAVTGRWSHVPEVSVYRVGSRHSPCTSHLLLHPTCSPTLSGREAIFQTMILVSCSPPASLVPSRLRSWVPSIPTISGVAFSYTCATSFSAEALVTVSVQETKGCGPCWPVFCAVECVSGSMPVCSSRTPQRDTSIHGVQSP